MDFNVIKTAVAAQFSRMQQHPMFRVDVDKDKLWETYLASFPPDANPMFRERTEHDCSCCRQFIRAVGDVVAFIDGAIESVWDCRVENAEPGYDAVCFEMDALVCCSPIAEPFAHHEPVAGTDRNFEQLTEGVKTWTHFHVNIDRRLVRAKDSIPSWISEQRSAHDVLLRSLTEITMDAIDTTLDLIAQSSLYRGEEHRSAVMSFQALKQRFDQLQDNRARDIFAWTADASGAVSRMRNTVIGTLLVDLSSGVDLEAAVRSFESKVAPTNYKRPTALITKGMIEKAKRQLDEMGLTSALDRRYARLADITINNVLFADRSTRKALGGSVFDELVATTASAPKNLDKVEEVSIDRFVTEILPRVDSIEVLVENRHHGNLVSLIAPADPTARHLFKWSNNFSWSYVGEVADAIKERVKQAGGNVTGDLCCRLAWSNYDDLDFHMVEPGGYEIYYGTRYSPSPSGGRLDVDMNVAPTTRAPVENIFYSDRSRMKEGNYHLFVRQFNARERGDCGFECEIDFLSRIYQFSYTSPLRTGEDVLVATLNYTHKDGLKIVESLPLATRILWGIHTQSFHRVNALMFSPNYWDDRAVGNKHFFFMLEGCRNDGTARGFFNEFLNEELNPHRKVFEVVASKMKPADSTEQLSGLGFSSTQRNTVVCRVKGSFTRTLKVTF